jgi:hypothetical protein
MHHEQTDQEKQRERERKSVSSSRSLTATTVAGKERKAKTHSTDMMQQQA